VATEQGTRTLIIASEIIEATVQLSVALRSIKEERLANLTGNNSMVVKAQNVARLIEEQRLIINCFEELIAAKKQLLRELGIDWEDDIPLLIRTIEQTGPMTPELTDS
jgi:hypothetical protein